MRIEYFLIALMCIFTREVSSQERGAAKGESHEPQTKLDSLRVGFKEKNFERQTKRDSIRENKKVWTSILGGPSYTPEANFGVGGAALLSFKVNSSDTISQRSFLPLGFNISLNGTFVLAGGGTLFLNENKFRIYASYGYRNEPTNFFGVGYDEIDANYQSDSTTLFKRSYFEFNPRFVWDVKPNLYLGTILDVSYTSNREINPVMANNSSYLKFGNKYYDVGIGALIQYDTRNDVATPTSGVLLSATATLYSKWLGSSNDYQILDLEYRHFQQMFNRRSTLGWTAKSSVSFGDVPFTSMPMFGSPFDLRGYLWGKYRDRSMGYGIVEYRHMFGSQEEYDRGALLAKLGAVAWVGAGAISDRPIVGWKEFRINYGVGMRIEIQPGKNFRLDIGQEPGQKWGFYMNMTEAF